MSEQTSPTKAGKGSKSKGGKAGPKDAPKAAKKKAGKKASGEVGTPKLEAVKPEPRTAPPQPPPQPQATASFAQVLGVAPESGRYFQQDEETFGGHKKRPWLEVEEQLLKAWRTGGANPKSAGVNRMAIVAGCWTLGRA